MSSVGSGQFEFLGRPCLVRHIPLLGKRRGGRDINKKPRSLLAGADGVVGSSHRLSEVERTTPAAPPKERDHLLDGAATPPLPRRGLRLSRRLSQTPDIPPFRLPLPSTALRSARS